MENHPTIQPDETDELLSVLADPRRRIVLDYLVDASAETATVDELARVVTERGHGRDEQVRIDLHHSALPKLATTGVVDYDHQRRVVRYRGHPLLETLLETVRAADHRAI